jgi:hypothetical protein
MATCTGDGAVLRHEEDELCTGRRRHRRAWADRSPSDIRPARDRNQRGAVEQVWDAAMELWVGGNEVLRWKIAVSRGGSGGAQAGNTVEVKRTRLSVEEKKSGTVAWDRREGALAYRPTGLGLCKCMAPDIGARLPRGGHAQPRQRALRARRNRRRERERLTWKLSRF